MGRKQGMVSDARRAAVAIVLVVGVMGAAGCGNDDSDSSSSSNPNTTTTATSTKTEERESSKSDERASKSPEQIVEQSASALEDARSFHLEGTVRVDGKRTAVKADFEQPGKLRMSFGQGAVDASIITTGSALYIKANEAFWKQQQVGEAASSLAGRWFRSPASGKEISDLTKDIDPKVLGDCLRRDHGSLEHGGTATVDGQQTVVIIDKGDKPGTAPGKLFVAATGKPFPLRLVATGPPKPGGKPDPRCDDDEGDDEEAQAGDVLTFSKFDEELGIKPPPKAVDLTQEAGGRTQS